MFGFIVENIIERYSREELSQRYGVDLPCKVKNESLAQNLDGSVKLDGHYYELENSKKFKKFKGAKAHINIINEGEALFFENRLSWLQKLLLSIMMFFNNLKLKILNFFSKFIIKLPSWLSSLVKYLLILPFNLAIVFISAIRGAFQSSGGILGIIIGLIFAILIVIPFKLLLELVGLVISPMINKIADSMMDKDFIKKMIIGKFMHNNYLDEGVLVSNSMVNDVSFEFKKNLLGQESLFVIINEGMKSVSLTDIILSKILPDYFVNRKTVFATNKENQSQFETIFKG